MDSKNDLMLVLERFLQKVKRLKEQQNYLIENIKINRVFNFPGIILIEFINFWANDSLHFDNPET